jgi:hypothetical protein
LAGISPVIQAWLQDCLNNHKRCSFSHVPKDQPTHKKLPTRLINIGNPSNDIPPFLYETRGTPDECSSYIALSHCWGASQIIKTETANYKTHQLGISWSKLSKTFQDAIDIARSLGVQYVWIDSLCIVQDDVDDWAREASQMASVYQNSFLTICATAADGGSVGCLLQRKISRVDGQHDGKPFAIYFRKYINHTPFQADSRPHGKRNLPLFLRGWTFQEQLLAPRIVHFTEEELVWECSENTVCECNLSSDLNASTKQIVAQALEEGTEQQVIWQLLIEEYSSRRLKYDWDRLPALSGISSQFTKLGEYLAGHWQIDLPHSLLWRVLPGHLGVSSASSPNSRISAPPSWSWASIECEGKEWIKASPWDTNLHLSQVKIIEAACYPSTSDPRGMVYGGHITMQGKLLELRLGTVNWTGNSNFWFYLYLPDEIDASKRGSADEAATLFVPDMMTEWKPQMPLYFFLLTSQSTSSGERVNYGLILLIESTLTQAEQALKLRTQSEHLYKRIGMAHLYRNVNEDLLMEKTITII